MGGGRRGGGEGRETGPEDKQSGEEGDEVHVCVHLFIVALQTCVHSDVEVRAKTKKKGKKSLLQPSTGFSTLRLCSCTCAQTEKKDKREQSRPEKGGGFLPAFNLFLTAARLHNSQADLVSLTWSAASLQATVGQLSFLFPLTINVHASLYPRSCLGSRLFPLHPPPTSAKRLFFCQKKTKTKHFRPPYTTWEERRLEAQTSFLSFRLTWTEEGERVQSQFVSFGSRCCRASIKQRRSSAGFWQTRKQGLYGLSGREEKIKTKTKVNILVHKKKKKK